MISYNKTRCGVSPRFMTGNDLKDLRLDEFEETLCDMLQILQRDCPEFAERGQPCRHISLDHSPLSFDPDSIKFTNEPKPRALLRAKKLGTFTACKRCFDLMALNFDNAELYNDSLKLETPYLNGHSANIIRFAFHHSDIWRSAINYLARFGVNKPLNIRILLGSLIPRFSLFRMRHWKMVILESNIMSKIAVHAQIQVLRLNHSTYSESSGDSKEWSFLALDLCFVFMIKWLKQYQKLQKVGLTSDVANESLSAINDLKALLLKYGPLWNFCRGMWWRNEHQDQLYLQIIDKHTRNHWNKIKSREQCQRTGCNMVRNNVEKWMKCSKCFATVYCSRKCAKYDWKYGKHRENCDVLSKFVVKGSYWS